MKENKPPFSFGSGDVFTDLGFSKEESIELTMKASLFRTLQKALVEIKGTQAEKAALLEIPQPKISDILNGKMSGFSVERIGSFLVKLNYEVHIGACPAPSGMSGRVVDDSKLLSA